MAGTIGDLVFDIVPVQPPTPRQTSTTWVTTGLDGFGALLDGSRAEEFTFTAIAYVDSNDDAVALGVAAIALQSTRVTVFNDWGDEIDNCYVLEVNTDNFKRPVLYLGNPDAVRCAIFWRMRVSH